MKTLTTTILTSAALATAAPALAQQSDGETDMPDFCETAFMPADQNKDGFMSEQEIKDARDAEFAALDLNKDGSVDREEMVNCIGKAEQNNREAMTQAGNDKPDWADLDTGDKTELSVEEYQNLTNKAWRTDDSDMKSAVSTDTDNAEEFAKTAVDRFKMYDSDGNGIVTQAEYESEIDKDWSDKALQKRFDAMDADGSDSLSPQEYRDAGTKALDMTAGTSESKNMDSGDSADASGNSDSSASDTQNASDETTVPVVIYYYSLV